ncbi:MAG TPA: 4-hydroxy-tetrahydrodipicolinate synthase, partial [Desulfobaccales bacterium]|nr:4-hydroxy-tetrahydrodipicolinate synthase [Desulfobaccales bacterium]
GADAALMITPYYNKPTQEGLYQHYKTVASNTKIPIVVYNVPSRTSVNLLPETVARLAELPTIKGIKEATGDLKQCAKVLQLCGDKITVLSGDDFTVLPLLAVGGMGVISVTSNVAPGDMAGMCNAFFKGDLAAARALHYKMWPLMEAMFFETNPTPAKTALKMMGKITGEVRQPLWAMSAANEDKLRQVMQEYGLI